MKTTNIEHYRIRKNAEERLPPPLFKIFLEYCESIHELDPYEKKKLEELRKKEVSIKKWVLR